MPSSRARKHTPDRGADYNALGRDPDGTMAWLVAFFFGTWLPPVPAHVFAGPLEPPRYGHPAQYQTASLPEGFKPRFPCIHGLDPAQVDVGDYLVPPAVWTPASFAALLQTSTFEDKALKKKFNKERKALKAEFEKMRAASAVEIQNANGYETEVEEDAKESSAGGRTLRRSRRNASGHTQ